MKKLVTKKLNLKADTLAILSSKELSDVAGGATTDPGGCDVDTGRYSFCVCATKHACTINC